MVGEAIPGEILPGDIALTGDGGAVSISAGKRPRFGAVTTRSTFVGYKAAKFGPVTVIGASRLTGFKATKFGQLNRPRPGAFRLTGFKATKFGVAWLLPSYNPIRVNMIRQLRGFKATKFGG